MCAVRLEDSTLLTAADGPPAAVLNAAGKGRAVVVCEHASNTIPAALGDLGLDAAARESHIAWDPGARPVARRMAERLDAVLVEARFSRLAYDLNRPPERADAIPERSEVYDIPGNRGLSEGTRRARVGALSEPFHATLAEVIAERMDRMPVLVTVHSFTPVYHGRARTVELGLLHDGDARMADWMLPRAGAATGLETRRNEPYGPADGVTHMLRVHGEANAIPHVMIEIRNDLIAAEAAQMRIADALADLVAGAAKAMRGGA